MTVGNVRSLENAVNFGRFLRPIAFLDSALREMACFETEPTRKDAEILAVMMEDRRRCPEWINVLFRRWRRRRKRVMVNMRILKTYYLKLLGEDMLSAECREVVALQFVCRLFGGCKLVEVEMESTANGDAAEWTQSCSDALCAELEAVHSMIQEKGADLREIKIYQIQIDEKAVDSLKERVAASKWTVETIKRAQKGKANNYSPEPGILTLVIEQFERLILQNNV